MSGVIKLYYMNEIVKVQSYRGKTERQEVIGKWKSITGPRWQLCSIVIVPDDPAEWTWDIGMPPKMCITDAEMMNK